MKLHVSQPSSCKHQSTDLLYPAPVVPLCMPEPCLNPMPVPALDLTNPPITLSPALDLETISSPSASDLSLKPSNQLFTPTNVNMPQTDLAGHYTTTPSQTPVPPGWTLLMIGCCCRSISSCCTVTWSLLASAWLPPGFRLASAWLPPGFLQSDSSDGAVRLQLPPGFRPALAAPSAYTRLTEEGAP